MTVCISKIRIRSHQSTLACGSSDGGYTIHSKDEECNEKMKILAKVNFCSCIVPVFFYAFIIFYFLTMFKLSIYAGFKFKRTFGG